VCELCALEEVQPQRARLAIYPLQEFLQQRLQLHLGRAAAFVAAGGRSIGALHDEIVRERGAHSGCVANVQEI